MLSCSCIIKEEIQVCWAQINTSQYRKKWHTSIIELNKNFTAAGVLEKLNRIDVISDEPHRTSMHRFFTAHFRLYSYRDQNGVKIKLSLRCMKFWNKVHRLILDCSVIFMKMNLFSFICI